MTDGAKDGRRTPRDELLAFDVVMRNDVWPLGEGVVHNLNDPCHNTPESGAETDLHTTPSDGKKLCWDCDWPEGAEEALNYDG